MLDQFVEYAAPIPCLELYLCKYAHLYKAEATSNVFISNKTFLQSSETLQRCKFMREIYMEYNLPVSIGISCTSFGFSTTTLISVSLCPSTFVSDSPPAETAATSTPFSSVSLFFSSE